MKNIPHPAPSLFTALSLATAIGLSACGGGHSDTSPATATPVPQSASAAAPAAPSGALNARSLEAARALARSRSAATTPLDTLAEGEIAAWDDYATGKVARKTTLRQPVYRFYNTQTTAHFYTNNEAEKDNVLATLPHFNFDGLAFHAASAYSPGLSPVYRFLNRRTGVHFYTISETEKANIVATMPDFTLEGPAYHASQVEGQGFKPLFRFFVPSRGFHFYSASVAERDNIRATLSATYTYEGIAYYVLDDNWTSQKLPHTGLERNQCYGVDLLTSTDHFGSCDGPHTAIAMKQDALLTHENPMLYRSVAPYPVTSCVADGVTGLVWEGKSDDGGPRDKDNTYTNLGNGASTDASGYVAAVNAGGLCGYTDWRLPTTLELATLLNYGTTSTPALNPTWFPNTILGVYWTSESTGAGNAWGFFTMLQSGAGQYLRSSNWSLRLVRGQLNTSSPRYSLGTVAYGSDAGNNVVNDAVSGLQWRRCLEGQSWNGTACTGTLNVYNHRSALVHGDTVSGWRLPRAKEARSMLEISHLAPYLNSLFPTPPMALTWTTTADVTDPLNKAYALSTDSGNVFSAGRSNFYAVRMVRTLP